MGHAEMEILASCLRLPDTLLCCGSRSHSQLP